MHSLDRQHSDGTFANAIVEADDDQPAPRANATQRAYAADWSHFSSWCRRAGFSPMPADPGTVALYLSACASGSADGRALSASTLERRLAGLVWNYAQRGDRLDRKDQRLADAVGLIRRDHARPPEQKQTIGSDDLLAMLETLGHDLRGLRDRAVLLIGFAGGLRRAEIVGLDCGADQSEDGSGWIDIRDAGLVVSLRSKTGWRTVEIGRGASDRSCPVAALEQWLKLSRISRGPVFRRVFNDGKTVEVQRLADKHVARLVKSAALAAGIRGDLPEAERAMAFASRSLRANPGGR
ncbi:site-specific integrase [Oryzicola mucosus]|uniref:Integrase n=1 Tax=Oryzicola mucosus TaxID=2767425 RepID=A0A8J6Q3A2_9HYPH|nr:integrase [Oryzicola mucosus]MBD0415400.1 integrase [Oryzicola mucosus]